MDKKELAALLQQLPAVIIKGIVKIATSLLLLLTAITVAFALLQLLSDLLRALDLRDLISSMQYTLPFYSKVSEDIFRAVIIGALFVMSGVIYRALLKELQELLKKVQSKQKAKQKRP